MSIIAESIELPKEVAFERIESHDIARGYEATAVFNHADDYPRHTIEYSNRYELTRSWENDDPLFSRKFGVRSEKAGRVLWILLNPSIAGCNNDPTVTKVECFTAQWGYCKLTIVNMFSLIATDPKWLKEYHQDKAYAHPLNTWFLERALRAHDLRLIVVGWGGGAPRGMEDFMCDLITKAIAPMRCRPPIMCLGLTAGGSPTHPGRIAYSTALEKYRGNGMHT